MRILMTLLIAALTLTISAQDDGYVMYETVRMQPDMTNAAGLKKAMTEHNKTYHKDGPYTALVWNISSGPDIGKIVWMMGPCTFTDLDSRPAGEHDVHWANEVLPHIKYSKNGEYWTEDADKSYMIGSQSPMVYIRYLEVARNQGFRSQGLLTKLSEAIKANEGSSPWSVYYNEFRQGVDIGRHIALVRGLTSWAQLDESGSLRQIYESQHGENSWTGFNREWNEVFANSWDEIWTLNTNMSGPDNE